MSIIFSALGLFASANMPSDNSSTAGGAIGTTQLLGAVSNEWFKKILPNTAGGADQVEYQKAGLKNTSSTDTLYNPKVSLANALTGLSVSAPVTVTFANATDATNTVALIFGFNATGVPQTETIIGQGNTSTITGSKTWYGGQKGIYAVQLQSAVNGVPTGIQKTLSYD